MKLVDASVEGRRFVSPLVDLSANGRLFQKTPLYHQFVLAESRETIGREVTIGKRALLSWEQEHAKRWLMDGTNGDFSRIEEGAVRWLEKPDYEDVAKDKRETTDI